MNKSEFSIDWKAFVIGFFVTLISLPFLNAIGPIISGIIVGYLVGRDYRSGIINSGLSVGIAALTYAIVVDALFKNAIVARAHSTGLSVETVIIISLIVAPIGGFVVGLIGGIIGVALKKRSKN